MRLRSIKFVLTGCVTLALVGMFAGTGVAHTARAASSAPPVKIGILYSNDAATSTSGDATVAVLKAAVTAQNARGGIGKAGQKVEVVPCNAAVNDANAALACVNDWIADPNVVALVGDSGTQSNAVDPLLEKAGLASVGPLALQQSDFTSPIAFPVSAGFATAGGQATVLADTRASRRSRSRCPTSRASGRWSPSSNTALAPRGAKVTTSVEAGGRQAGLLGRGHAARQQRRRHRHDHDGRADGPLDASGPVDRRVQGQDDRVQHVDASTRTTIKTLGSLANGIYVVTGGIATTDVKVAGHEALPRRGEEVRVVQHEVRER